ncbi:MAG: DUF424 family protein [Candidatus Micrarchaeia archaeon]
MIYIKIHYTESSTIVAMCDESLINSILEEGDIYIDIKMYADFYKGDLVDSKKVSSMLENIKIGSANIIGKESIDTAINLKLIEEDNIKYVNKIPYAHSYYIKYA